MKKGKLRIIEEDYVSFYCPGCKGYHSIYIGGNEDKHPVWSFNGDYDNPTFSPSVLCRGGHYITGHEGRCWCDYNREHPDSPVERGCFICHIFVTEGKIQYLSDCTHALAGTTVDLPDLPDKWGDEE